MGETVERTCPGCGLDMPADDSVVYDGYFNCSPECWSVFTEVMGEEFGNAVIFGQAHQLTVDAYAVQHAGGPHPDKSVDIHLAGLHLMLDRGLAPTQVPPLLQSLANGVAEWPHFPPPAEVAAGTILDIALAESWEAHIEGVRAWAGDVWTAWSEHHESVVELVDAHLSSELDS